MSDFRTVSIVGLGYIGLPLAAILASQGLRVIGMDTNRTLADAINRGQAATMEPGLAELTRSAVESGRLTAVSAPEPAEAFVITVPTPFREEDHQADLSYVRKAAESLAPVLKRGDLIIIESTCPVGATELTAGWLQAARPDLRLPRPDHERQADICLAYCPERILPGRMLRELVNNDRVIGGLNRASAEKAADLYRIFVKGELRLTTAGTAEMVKLAENAFRDLNIAFANELSLICRRLGLDVWELIDLANRHPRVNILKPGPGVGGHCIAVDPWFIISQAPDLARLIRTARQVNDAKPACVLAQIREMCAEIAQQGLGRPIKAALLGLTFKADVDDMRESPAATIARRLLEDETLELRLVEPNLSALPPDWATRLFTLDEALTGADLVVQLVAHRQFTGLAARLDPKQRFLNCVGPDQ